MPTVQRHEPQHLCYPRATDPGVLGRYCHLVNALNGISVLQLGQPLEVQYKTAFVLAHKLRGAIGAE